jgi:hypothetical protein
MAALTKDRNTPLRAGEEFSFGVATNAKIYAGALIVLNATGFAAPATAAAGLKAVGVAQEFVDNTGGADGAKTVKVRAGLFRFAGDGTVTAPDIGKLAYAVDDQTVADNDNAGARSAAGAILDVDADGVWVEVGARKNLAAVAALDFPAVAAAGQQELTINVAGAETGDSVSLGLPAAPPAGLVYQAYVSAAGIVTVRATNITAAAIDPASASFRVTVIKG